MRVRAGPFRLDLGDVLYAPNAFIDPAGCRLMLAWLQELRSGGTYKYAGCLSVPRVLSLRGQHALTDHLRALSFAALPFVPFCLAHTQLCKVVLSMKRGCDALSF